MTLCTYQTSLPLLMSCGSTCLPGMIQTPVTSLTIMDHLTSTWRGAIMHMTSSYVRCQPPSTTRATIAAIRDILFCYWKSDTGEKVLKYNQMHVFCSGMNYFKLPSTFILKCHCFSTLSKNHVTLLGSGLEP